MARSNVAASFRAARLIIKYLRGQLTGTERDELDDWLAAGESNRALSRQLDSEDVLERELENFRRTDKEAAWLRVEYRMTGKIVRIKYSGYRKIGWQSAAAILILAFGVWQFWYHGHTQPSGKKNLISQYGEDVMPGTKKAELILGNGTTVKLDNGTDSTFTENGSLVQRRADGMLIYAKRQTNKNVASNTIRVPNGGEYKLVLEDGTRIWLNAASSLRYPVRFNGSERRVELTSGEAYFEIAKNKEKPFIVVSNRMKILALGTAFDVNSYNRSDSAVYTTLTEGSVQVTTKNRSHHLHPGEQIVISEKTVRTFEADTEAVTGWKNGLFSFNGTALPEVMEELARWYNVKIEYEDVLPEMKFFTGEIRRNVPVSRLLEMMELTGVARFRITNNTIFISNYAL